jgi:hypothetical protein
VTAAIVYGFAAIFGHGAIGPIIVSALLLAGLARLGAQRVRRGAPAEAPA